MPYLTIDPEERLDFTFDWTDFLSETGSPADTISGASFTITPLNDGSPSEPVLSGMTVTASSATIHVANCVAGRLYHLSNRVSSAAGRVAHRTITLRCERL